MGDGERDMIVRGFGRRNCGLFAEQIGKSKNLAISNLALASGARWSALKLRNQTAYTS